MGRLDDVCNTLVTAITDAINAAGAVSKPGQVIVGWPLGPELVEIFGQGPGEWQVSVFPQKKGTNNTRFRPCRTYKPPTVNLSCGVDGGVVTFSGSVDAGLNVHTVLDTRADAYFATTSGMSLDDCATALAAAVNALDLPGVSATASGAAATISGVGSVVCNIAGVGSSTREVSRIGRDIQISVWASDPDTVSSIESAITQTIGIATAPKLALPDGSLMWVRYAGELWNDESQSSYSLYVSHHLMWCEYGIMQTESAYQIGAVEFSQRVNNSHAPVTAWYGDI